MKQMAYEIRKVHRRTGEDLGVAICETCSKVQAQRYATIMNRVELKHYPKSPIKYKAVKY